MTERFDASALLDAKRRDTRRMGWATAALVVIVVLAMGLGWGSAERSRVVWQEIAADGKQAHAELSGKYTALYDEYVRDTGHLPGAETPAEATDTGTSSGDALPGPAGPAGPVGPVGPPGPAGEPGADASPEMVGEAVAGYCAENFGCVGPMGATGMDGQSVTPEMVAAAVDAYCADRDGCRGPAGVDGTNGQDGAPGAPGRGIASLTCTDGRWAVTYTDGTTADAGACVPLEPVPDPAEPGEETIP